MHARLPFFFLSGLAEAISQPRLFLQYQLPARDVVGDDATMHTLSGSKNSFSVHATADQRRNFLRARCDVRAVPALLLLPDACFSLLAPVHLFLL